MATVTFKFDIGDTVYLVKPQGGCCATSVDLPRTVLSLLRYHGTNYYNLDDGSKIEEEYLFSEAEYAAYLNTETINVRRCAEKKLEEL